MTGARNWDLCPGVEPQDYRDGVRGIPKSVPTLTEANFQRWRDQRDFTSWKYRMHDCGCRMPTQEVNGRSRCFCGEALGPRKFHGEPMMDDLTKREVTMITAGLAVGAVLVAVLTRHVVVQVLAPSDPSDPITKAGGLAPTQDIRKAR